MNEKLKEARTDVITEFGRTDVKAAALVSAFGIPFAVLVVALPGRELNPVAAVLVGLGAVGLVAAILVVLLALRPPRVGRPRGSFFYWATCTTPEEVIADVVVDRRAERLITLSGAVERKFAALRLAIEIFGGSVVLLVLALITGLV
ncbi:Pycsar system effector family protein [Streptomyces marianii]|uniref:Pycsar system effector family protein n=1 Tax=Streptomyces marianii TaxID=1817406 RepID=UPI0018F8BE7B|nr:Pycsar system effector family protein [Streptomyces marianii]